MLKWLAGKSQRLALFLVISSLMGAFGWLYRSAKSSKTNFLPAISAAEWIIFPKAPEGRIHPHLELATVFRRSFVLSEVPAQTDLRICAFHRYSLLLNGRELETTTHGSWKSPDRFSISDALHPGTNEILVTAFNTNGPPALWLCLRAANFTLKSDESWEASYAGAVWKNALLAKKPLPVPPGNGLYGGESPKPAFEKCWPALLLFAVISAFVIFLAGRLKRTDTVVTGFKFKQWFPVGLLAALWIALFANNLAVLPISIGYDISGHLEYVTFIQTQHSLPLASDGWEMFQPPLYYILCAALLEPFSLTVHDPASAIVLRIFGLIIGIVHFAIVWKSLRLLFPENAHRQKSGLLLAAFLAPLIFLSHYISNEGLAAALVSASVYLCLRILKQEHPSLKSFAGLGACLGAALLTKSTAVLALPPVFGALVWKGIAKREAQVRTTTGQPWQTWISGFGHILIALAVCLVVCGWHYYRTWHNFGTPIVGVWDPKTGFLWWQDNAFHTAAFYLRFGQVFFHPWFSALHSFADGFYSTLWGDGLMGGSDSLTGPPWNFDFMMLAYWLAIVPTLGAIIGAFLSIRRFLREPSPEWFLLLGLGFLVAWAVIYMSLTIPYYCVVKAFYGFSALIPFCAISAWGLERMGGTGAPKPIENNRFRILSSRFRGRICSVLLGVWALTSFGSFWIIHSSVPTLLTRVAALMKANHTVDAQRLLEERLVPDPQNFRVRAELARVLIANRNDEQAIKEASLASQADPDDHVKLATLAMALARKDPDLAIEQARQAIKIAPGYTLAYQQLAALLPIQGHSAEVEQIAREGLALEPFNPIFHQTLGETLVRRGEVAEGISQLKLSCQLGPNNVWAHSALADAYASQNETSDAIAEYTEVLRLQPDSPVALNNLAWSRATNPRPEFRDGPEAVRLAERACQITDHKEPMFIGTLAAAYAEAGRFEEATKTAMQARDLAQATAHKDLVEKNEELIKLFAARQPYRQVEK